MLEIEVNNGRRLRLILDENGLTVEHINSAGMVERRDRFGDPDLVTMVNWAIFQSENNNPGLTF